MKRFSFAQLLPTCAFVALSAFTLRADSNESILDQIDQLAKGIKDLSCHFEEAKYTALLKKPVISSGTLRVLRGNTRWDTTTPYHSVLYTSPTSLAIYFPERSTMEVYPVDHQWRNLAVSPIPRVATLKKMFLIEVADTGKGDTSARVRLRLTPKPNRDGETGSGIAEFIEHADVYINPETGMASRFEMFDPEGDRTVITFDRVRTNTGVTDADVKRTVPAQTKIVYPMGRIDDEDTSALTP